jgi:hypothetical protein
MPYQAFPEGCFEVQESRFGVGKYTGATDLDDRVTLRRWLGQFRAWQVISRYSWVVTLLSLVLLTVGSVVAGVTAPGHFEEACGKDTFCVSALGSYTFATVEGWIIVLGIVIGAVASYADFEDKELIDDLRAQIAQKDSELDTLRDVEKKISEYAIDTYSVISSALKVISEDIQAGTDERISVYKVDAGKFFLIGRYSSHAEFNKQHRRYYPLGQGVIHKAWEIGWHEAKITAHPKRLTKYATEIERKFGVPSQIVRAMHMKSRLYKAIALNDRRTGDRLAILCVESLQPNALNGVDRADLETRCKPLIVILEALEPHIVSLDDAIAEGY